MKRFNEQYKEFYKNIKADEELKENILSSCLNLEEQEFQLKKMLFPKRILFSVCFVLIAILIGTSLVFAKDIENFVKTHIFKLELNEERSKEYNKNIYTFTIENPINERVNCDSDINEEMKAIKKEELEEKLGIKLLSSDLYDNNLYYIKILEKVDNKLAYANFERDTLTAENSFFKEDVEKITFSSTKIDLSMIFLTPYATEEIKNKRVAFQKNLYNNEKSEIIFLSSLGVEIYFAPLIDLYVERYDVELITKAYFIYDNVMYVITGELVNKNTILDFIKSLH